ncbi:MAG: UDP-N-acetylmuramate dehydrogenase [Candidatus Colwellbacteria bacterium]|nr:UDP-N-acetylmuramate dehydrogenase [Candidatus Colwellbacteria bacterium]
MQKSVWLKEHTTYKIGGPAAYFVEVKDVRDIEKAVSEWKSIGGDVRDIFILGGGANVLLPDSGFSGLILKISIAGIDLTEKGLIEAGAGTLLKDIVEFAADKELSGMEWAAGLPGSFAGAIRGNAGAFGGEMKDVIIEVKSVELSSPDKIIIRRNKDCEFDYRTSRYKKEGGEVIISAIVKLSPGEEKNIRDRMDEYVKYREDHQPLEYPSAGSTFKNIDVKYITSKQKKEWATVIKNDPFPVVPVAFLLSEAGLKGKRIGGAVISEKHPNFFINYDNATADDVKKLISLAQKEVKNKFNIDIEPEIQIIDREI